MTYALLQGARSVSLFLVALLAIAAIHKIVALRQGAAVGEPVLTLSEWRLRHARSLIVAVAAIEIGLAVGLLVSPAVAALVSTALFAGYLRELRRLAGDASCNCLGSFLNLPDRRLELLRNWVFVGLSIAVAAISLALGRVVAVSQLNLGIGVVLLALFTSLVRLAQLKSRDADPMDRERRSRSHDSSDPVPPTELVRRRSIPA